MSYHQPILTNPVHMVRHNPYKKKKFRAMHIIKENTKDKGILIIEKDSNCVDIKEVTARSSKSKNRFTLDLSLVTSISEGFDEISELFEIEVRTVKDKEWATYSFTYKLARDAYKNFNKLTGLFLQCQQIS